MGDELLDGSGCGDRDDSKRKSIQGGPECGSERSGIVDVAAGQSDDGNLGARLNHLNLQSLVAIKSFLLRQNRNDKGERMTGDREPDRRRKSGLRKRHLK